MVIRQYVQVVVEFGTIVELARLLAQKGLMLVAAACGANSKASCMSFKLTRIVILTISMSPLARCKTIRCNSAWSAFAPLAVSLNAFRSGGTQLLYLPSTLWPSVDNPDIAANHRAFCTGIL
jgi:hypothetical protein